MRNLLLTYRSLFIAICLTTSLYTSTFAQKPTGRFLQDTTRLGQPVEYAFSYRHSPATEVFFPDSTFDFGAFEYRSREIFVTSTDHRGSLDSVVYTLVPYSPRNSLVLSLPVFVIAQQDCTLVQSVPDTLFLRTFLNDSTSKNARVLADYELNTQDRIIDYWKYIRYIGSVVFVLGIFYALFGKPLERIYKGFLYQRRHREFVTKFKRWIRDANDRDVLSNALITWKKHMQWLDGKPYTTFTTQEINETIENDRLRDALREIDMAIFGGVESKYLPLALNRLLEVANEVYNARYKEYREALRAKTPRRSLAAPLLGRS